MPGLFSTSLAPIFSVVPEIGNHLVDVVLRIATPWALTAIACEVSFSNGGGNRRIAQPSSESSSKFVNIILSNLPSTSCTGTLACPPSLPSILTSRATVVT